MLGISDLLDSDVEGFDNIDENSILSSDATDGLLNSNNKSAAKKIKKRHRVTMPKTKSRITKSSPAANTKKSSAKVSATKRKELESAVDNQTIAETQPDVIAQPEAGIEVEEIIGNTHKPTSKKRGRKPKASEKSEIDPVEADQTPMVARSSHEHSATKRVTKVAKQSKAPAKAIQKQVVPETQMQPTDVVPEMEEMDEIAAQQPPSKRARTESRTRREPAVRRRAGSASDTERGDPSLRRKLGDITRKFENIDMKYKNLKEVGVHEASSNVEKLRRQCEATAEASNNLISSLREELNMQAPLVQDARRLKKELQAKDQELLAMQSSQVSLNAALAAASSEIKALQTKLAAARTASASIEPPSTRPPGSAMKPSKSQNAATSEATHTAQMAQMKLDLYGDLTGLIIRGVKRAEDGVTFDCIQTGRNGTLHFKLFIDQEDAKTSSFEETEFLYTPLLDADRDHDMIELMPPYLVDDITFARQNASKFYQRVVDTLTRRVNDE